MNAIRSVLSVLGVIFVLLLVVFATLKIWVPDIVNDDVFVKLVLTFAVFALGSLLMRLLSFVRKDSKE